MKIPQTIYALLSILFLGIFSIIYQNYQINKTLDHTNKVLLDIHSSMATHEEEMPLIKAGTQGANFELINQDSIPISLQKYANTRFKVLTFSSSRCAYCKEFYPELQKFAEKHQDIPVLIVQEESSVSDNKNLLQTYSSFKEILVANQSVLENYEITGTPTTIVLDNENKVVVADFFGSEEELADSFLK